MSKTFTVAIVGNPNVGKTALVNTMAGSRLKIGNWPGVTVEKKEASFRYENCEIRLIDLPGVYSLNTITQEEIITKNYLRANDYDVILNVIDANNTETNLYLTSQLLELGKPMIVAVNFWEEFTKNGNRLDLKKISGKLNVSVIPIEAIKSETKKGLFDTLLTTQSEMRIPAPMPDSKTGRNESVRQMLHTHIHLSPKKRISLTDCIDNILLQPVLGMMGFISVFYFMFKWTYDGSAPFILWIDDFFNIFIRQYAGAAMDLIHSPPIIKSFLFDGLIAGIGTVMTFIPLMAFLYFFIALLEESGYIARVAYLLDRYMRKIGLQGKTFIPLLIGFGCNVPGVYATRTLEEGSDKKVVASIISFMSCGAKLPIYILFTSIFFPKNPALIAVGMYFLGVLVAVAWALILKKWIFPSNSDSLIIELPEYRLPTARVVWNSVRYKILSFVKRAGTVITAVVILIWALTNLPYGVTPDKSILSSISKTVTPVFKPLGWGKSWRATASVVPGFLAKEAVIGALATTYDVQNTPTAGQTGIVFVSDLIGQGFALKDAVLGSGKSILAGLIPGVFSWQENGDTPLIRAVRNDFTALMALSYMVFNLLLMSCTAVMGAIKQEFGGKFLLFTLLVTGGTAYAASLAVYQLGRLLGYV